MLTPANLFGLAWAVWMLSWLLAAVWSRRTESAVSAARGDVWLYRGLVVLGFVLINSRMSRALSASRLWHVGLGGAWALVGATCAGLLFTWWARIHLGSLWSGSVTRKEGHRVIDTGPYALVRHPIYTGLIAASLATASAVATVPALVGVGCVAAGFWIKARIEERFLAAELEPEAYASYRRRVPMLVPFWPAG